MPLPISFRRIEPVATLPAYSGQGSAAGVRYWQELPAC
jgi:hypothetical protein